MSRKFLAESAGISEYFLVEIETGRKGVSSATLCALSEALHISTDGLLKGTENAGDIDRLLSMLKTLDGPLLEGAEEVLKAYLNAVTFIKTRQPPE